MEIYAERQINWNFNSHLGLKFVIRAELGSPTDLAKLAPDEVGQQWAVQGTLRASWIESQGLALQPAGLRCLSQYNFSAGNDRVLSVWAKTDVKSAFKLVLIFCFDIQKV